MNLVLSQFTDCDAIGNRSTENIFQYLGKGQFQSTKNLIKDGCKKIKVCILFHKIFKATAKTTLAYFIDPFFLGPILQLSISLCNCQSLSVEIHQVSIYNKIVTPCFDSLEIRHSP